MSLEFLNEVIYLKQIPAEGRQTYFPSAPFFQLGNKNNYFCTLPILSYSHTYAQWPQTHTHAHAGKHTVGVRLWYGTRLFKLTATLGKVIRQS